MLRLSAGCVLIRCLMGGNCEPDGGFQFGVNRWSQLGGSSSSQGFLAARSGFAVESQVKWERDIGGESFGSPSVGPDGTIYVGTTQGELVAVTPEGSIRWRRDFFPDSVIVGTPAVADDGSIFVIYSQFDDDGQTVSTLNRVSPDGAWLWARLTGDTEGSTTASPKVLGPHVFVFAHTPRSELLVFDFDADIVARDFTAGCTPVCGQGIDIGGALNTACCAGGLFGLPACILSLGCSFDSSGVPAVLDDPSVAVADFASVAPDGLPFVVVVDNFCMTAYRLNPPELEFLWHNTVFGGDCDDNPVQHSSPAIFPDGQVVVGNVKGKVRSFFPETGKLFWEYDAEEAVRAAPASIGRQIHVASRTHVHFLDSDGEFLAKFHLPGSTRGAPALSADFAYVSFAGGLHTFSFDLFSNYAVDTTVAGGLSAPAIGGDGTIYVVTSDGTLRAYGSSGFLQQQLGFPLARITEPADGAEFTRLSSVRTYTVEVTDPLVGTVTISSDVDGELCSTEGSGRTFSCTGPGAGRFGAVRLLSLGRHVITATATDQSGAAGTDTITIEVTEEVLAPE